MILWYCYIVWGVGAITLRWWLPYLTTKKYVVLKAFIALLIMPFTVAAISATMLWATVFVVLTYKSKACLEHLHEDEPKKPADQSVGEYP